MSEEVEDEGPLEDARHRHRPSGLKSSWQAPGTNDRFPLHPLDLLGRGVASGPAGYAHFSRLSFGPVGKSSPPNFAPGSNWTISHVPPTFAFRDQPRLDGAAAGAGVGGEEKASRSLLIQDGSQAEIGKIAKPRGMEGHVSNIGWVCSYAWPKFNRALLNKKYS